MKRIWFGVVLSFVSLNSFGQIYEPIKWSFDSKQVDDNLFDLYFTAELEEHWHVYSSTLSNDEGPIPTELIFTDSDEYELDGKVKEPKPLKQYDPNFDKDLLFFDNKVTFTQRVKVNAESATVKGELTYMVCDDSKCLPPDYIDFSFDLKPSTSGKGNTGPPSDPVPESAPADNGPAPSAETSIQLEGTLEPSSAPEQPTIFNPVSWEFKAEKISENEYDVILTASIDDGWHLYSQTLENQDGPVATEISFTDTTNGVTLNGKAKEEGEMITEYDKNFQMNLSYYAGKVSFRQTMKVEGLSSVKGNVYFMVCDDSKCLPPEEVEFDINLSDATMSTGNSQNKEEEEETSLMLILLYSFLGGLGALLTPCVFPMIPMTVSFFTKQSKTRSEGVRKGITYGASIIAIYVLCSVPFHLFDSISPDVFNEFSTDPYLNIFFFLVFLIFAISFLGAFEITLPSSWVNKADRQADKGGLIGIFFMALTLILVSFSCTGPAIGLLLGSVLSTDGGATFLSVGLFGFGLGLGLPFGIFAAFPGWLNSLPQSGGWLNSVKVVFGFVELAFAFKFLSNADLVTQSGYLPREVFLAIWIAIFFALTLYLFGFIRLPHDSEVEKLSVGRTLLATLTLTFTIYLIPGMWGAPLKLIAGFPPPAFYSESPNGFGKQAIISSSSDSGDSHGSSSSNSHATCPHNLNCFHDYEEGLAYAKEVGKPVMIDFTGWACVNCRKMEEQVWSEQPVLSRLQDNIVLISLYVDEKAELPDSEKYVSETTGKKIKSVGNKWSDFQISNYQSNTQPYYVIIDHDENQLIESASYDPDVDLFVDWLDRGVAEFKKAK